MRVSSNKKNILIFLKLFFFISPIYSLVVGSDASPSRQSLITFLEADSDNEMKGFAAFESGFKLETLSTTCTFNSFFPVSGTVDMSGGTLYLSKDLKLDSGAALSSLGNVYGNNFEVEFSESISTMTVIPVGDANADSWGQVDVHTHGVAIDKCGWTYDDNFVLNVSSSPGGSDLYTFDGSTISEVDSQSFGLNGHDFSVHPSDYYFAVGLVSFPSKNELRVYNIVSQVIGLVDGLDLDTDVYSVCWSSNGAYIAAGCDSDTRVFSFTSEVLSQEASMSLGAGEAPMIGAISFDQTGNYYAMGIDHVNSSKLGIYYFLDPSITETNYFDTGSDGVSAVDWSTTGSWIAIGTEGSSDQLRVYEYNSSTNSLTEKTKISVGSKVNSVHWNSGATRLLVAKEIDAGGNELQVYSFNQAAGTLSLAKQAEKTTNINEVYWSNDNSYFTYVADTGDMIVYSYTAVDSGNTVSSFILDNVSFILDNDMSWRMSTTIQGECLIDARGNRIALEGNGVLSISSGAQLAIENAELSGLTDQTFRCLVDNSSIVLRDCTIHLDNDFTFDKGSILFDRDVIISGTNQFIYSSSQTSTIASNSTLVFDSDTTFKYSPPIANRDLLYMTDEVAFLYLNNCTLHSTSTGLRFTRGTVFLENIVTFSCDGTEDSESICFGNGTAADDVTVNVLSNADINVYGGICYENVN